MSSGPPWDALLLDIDGVLHVGDEPIEGAQAALALLREREIPFRLVTNTTSRSRRLVVERLQRLGLAVEEGDVLTPAGLAVARCRAEGHERVVLAVADALKEDLASLTGVEPEAGADAVVLGDLGDGFTWERLNGLFRALDDGAELIALQRNRVWQREDGLVLDAGPFVAALEYATGRDAVVVGKPAGDFFAAALAELGVDASRAAMVGDDLEADVGGALAAGLGGVLVRTGKHRDSVLAASEIEPTLILGSIADIADLLA